MDNGVDAFTERMLSRARQRHSKQELGKEVLREVSFPPSGNNRNVTVTSTSVDIRKDCHSNKVTIETKVTMKKLPNKNNEDMVRKTNWRSCDHMETDETDITTEEESEEENCAPVEEENVEQQNHTLRPDAKSRLKKLGALYSDDNKLLLSPPIPRTEEHFCVETENKPSVHPNARSARLAALANTINQWEDDLNHPSVIKQKSDKAEMKSSLCNKDRKSASGQTNNRIFSQIPINSATKLSFKRNKSCQEKGHFGDLNRLPISQGANRENKKSTTTNKNIMWDNKVLDSLQEAQGFFRSESNKRLIYDYTDDKHISSLDRKEEKSILPNSSPQKICIDTRSSSKMIPDKDARCESSELCSTDLNIREIKSSNSHSKVCSPKMGISQLKSPRKNDASIPQTGSVLNKVTEYEGSISPTKKVKDPAELPLAERKALFEKNSGSAILPKAPFAMPVPAKTLLHNSSNEITNYSTQKSVTGSHEKGKPTGSTENFEQAIPSTLHSRIARFEQKLIGDDEKAHTKGTVSERQKEIEMLRHRWDRHKGLTEKNQDAINQFPPIPPPFPSAPPLLEQDDENVNTLEVKNRHTNSGSGTGYPVIDYVRKIKVSPPKPGRLYPCLSDIEADSELTGSEENHEDADNSGISASSEEYSSNYSSSSLGQEIVTVSNRSSRSNLKRDWTVDEKSGEDQVLSEIDCFLDEALADQSGCSDEATPPKRCLAYVNHNSGSSHSHSFEYTVGQQKEDIESMESVGYKSDTKQPLVHSISLYRKQQTLSMKPSSPVRHIILDASPDLSGDYYPCEHDQQKESELVDQKIEELQQEVGKQQTIISQASQALNLCCSTIEFSGSTEQVEAERLLLLATHKRQAALHEIQRLSVEGTLRPKGPENLTLKEQGNLTISKITLPLKLNIICDAAREEKCFYLVCLVKCGEHVLATNLISTVSRTIHDHNKITFPNTLTLEGLYSDFKVTIEVYTITGRNKEVIPHDVKYHISTNKKDTCKLKLTPRKGKGDSRLVMPSIQSPGGPSAVRSPSFTMAGYVIFSLREVNRTQFTLNKVAYTSVLEGTVHLKVECEMAVDIEYRGFLTMFEDVSGFGAWYRRWCLLKGDTLSYWKYPEDERNKVAIDTIELTSCITPVVGPVSRDLCARPNTFLLETSRDARNTDNESLVLKSDGNKTIIRHLLSADTKEERLQWCEQLNKALALLRSWGRKPTK